MAVTEPILCDCCAAQDLVVTTTLVLVVLTTVCVGSSLEYAVMSLSRAYAAGGGRPRHSPRPFSPAPSPLEDAHQETLAMAFLSPLRGQSTASEESPFSSPQGGAGRAAAAVSDVISALLLLDAIPGGLQLVCRCPLTPFDASPHSFEHRVHVPLPR